MPELPELEAFKSYINKHCMHKQIIQVTCSDKKLIKGTTFAHFQKTVTQAQFQQAERLGKYLVIKLSHTQELVVMHFGLTGSLYYTHNLLEKVRFSKIIFYFKDNSALHWTCIRKFERVWLVADIKKIAGLKNLGPDALAITKQQFLDLLDDNFKKNIKALLMDQKILAGIGNEYSDEILFQAGIDPHHSAQDLSATQKNKLYTALHKVLKYAIKVQIKNSESSSGPDFFSRDNRHAFASTYLQAHRHIDMFCPKNHKHHLKIAKIAGRTSYFCPIDQK